MRNRLNSTQKRHYYHELLSIGIPIIIGQLGTIVLGFADTLMIGHHSTEELAAAGLVNNIFTLVLVSYMGFSYGLTPIIGRLYGMEKTNEIGGKVRNSLFANIIVGLIFTLAMVILYFNLGNIGQPEELLSLIRPYFIINLVSILFVGVFNTAKQFLDGIANTKVAMWVMIFGNVVNIFGNWLLIYGVGPFPELGLAGAGISTTGSRILMALIMVGVIVFKKEFKQYGRDIIKSSITKDDFKEMNRLGWPVALQLAMESAAFTLSCVMVGWLGTIPLAAHQIMITISQLFYLVLSGMAAAIAIRISHFVGQKDYAAVKRNAYDGWRINIMLSLLLGIPVVLFRHQIYRQRRGSAICFGIDNTDDGLPVWRRLAIFFCQCAAWHSLRKTNGYIRFHSLLRNIATYGLHLRFPLWLRHHRHLACIPCGTNHCRLSILAQIHQRGG